MKLQRFSAKKVHGYINIDLVFNEDVTFVTGLNGSGKTSALRLIMGLITPSLFELASIEFGWASLSVHTPGGVRTISAERSKDLLTIGLSGIAETLSFERRELLRLKDAERDIRDMRDFLPAKGDGMQVLHAISEIATPMFLGLARSQSTSDLLWEDTSYDARQREMWIRQREMERELMARHSRHRGQAAGLQTLQVLVQETIAEIRRQNESLDTNLRKNILNEALKYIPLTHASLRLPERSMVERLREKERDIDATANRLNLPELKASVRDFTARLATLIEKIEAEEVSKATKKATANTNATSTLILEWLANKAQADRVLKILEFVDQYTADRDKLYDAINRFVAIVNSFFIQTGKRVGVAENGTLEIRMSKTKHIARDVSSGEQQILIMLAHLALDRRLATSGVFIVDEPELSLHIAWQEMFVDAILKANPACQVILATHSPAIIMDRDAKCEIIAGQEG